MGSKKPFWQVLVAFMLVGTVVGVVFEFQPQRAITSFLKQAQTTRFRQVTGKVTKLDRQHLTVEYTYGVGGKRYVSDRIGFTTNGGFSAVSLLEDVEVGGEVTVYVHPSNDAESVLLSGLDMISCMPLMFAFVFTLAGCSLAVSFFRNRKPIETQRQDLQQQIRDDSSYDQPHIKRKRLVPGRFSPLTAGLACFGVGSISILICIYLGEWLFQWWKIDLISASLISILLGAGMGVFDYYHTLNENKRGRWDLVIDSQKGTLQVPANGAWGEPLTVPLDTVLGISRQLLFEDTDEKPMIDTYQLRLHYRDFGVDSTHPFYTSTDATHLDALAEWIHEQIGITLGEESEAPLGFADRDLQTAQETNR